MSHFKKFSGVNIHTNKRKDPGSKVVVYVQGMQTENEIEGKPWTGSVQKAKLRKCLKD